MEVYLLSGIEKKERTKEGNFYIFLRLEIIIYLSWSGPVMPRSAI